MQIAIGRNVNIFRHVCRMECKRIDSLWMLLSLYVSGSMLKLLYIHVMYRLLFIIFNFISPS